jgi:outer membrane protein OmpA-like peptidoglycan-associated protein
MSTPYSSPQTTQAHSALTAAEQEPSVATYSAVELQRARQWMGQSDAAAKKQQKESADHYAHLAENMALVAEGRARVKVADEELAKAEGERTRIQLAARDNDVTAARSATQLAQARTQQETAKNQQLREDSAALQQQSQSLKEQNDKLAKEMDELKAKQTPRGLVLTLGDVLFDTGKSELKSGAERSLDRLVQFLTEHPERKLRIEGFTDSMGAESSNQALSERRAYAVRDALSGRGIAADRISIRGYGEGYPVASNSEAAGRQLNRRVEIIIGSETGDEVPARS